MKKLIGSVALGLAVSTANAAIIDIQINKTYVQGEALSDITTEEIVLTSDTTLRVDPGSSHKYLDFEIEGAGMIGYSGIDTVDNEYGVIKVLKAGDVVHGAFFKSQPSVQTDWGTVFVRNKPVAGWEASHKGFMGIKTNGGLYGFIEYNFEKTATETKITLLRAAIEDSGACIATSHSVAEVPVPAAVWLFGSALLGLAGVRKNK